MVVLLPDQAMWTQCCARTVIAQFYVQQCSNLPMRCLHSRTCLLCCWLMQALARARVHVEAGLQQALGEAPAVAALALGGW